MPFPRASGILLHPSSLPSRGGIGDFGPSAYAFADFLASARQGLWQVLPLGPLGYGNSPYSSTSAFAGNPLLISLERLADRGWIDHARVDALTSGVEPVDYSSVFRQKLPLLFEAARNFVRSAAPNARSRYENFCRQNEWWLDDFVLFDGLRARFELESWNR
jgi:4-alpha-glucanotransferase